VAIQVLEYQAEIGERFRRTPVGSNRCLHAGQRRCEVAALALDQPELMKRVRFPGVACQHLGEQQFDFAHAPFHLHAVGV
jgi:hypothetical protein